jgi:anti-anti-sigma regulatory factor
MPKNTSVIHVDGSLLADTASPMRRALSEELLRVPELLAISFAGVTTIDSAGIEALTSAATQAGETDIALCLLGTHHSPVGAALAQANRTELFEMFNCLDDIDIPLHKGHDE